MNGNRKSPAQTIFLGVVVITVLLTIASCKPANCDTASGDFCTKCLTGFSLASNRADGAFDLCVNPCLKGFKSETINYVTYSAATCVPCDVKYCEKCDSDKAFCERCKYNTWLYDGNSDGKYEACIDCPFGNAVSPAVNDGTGVCIKCSSNCRVCNPADECLQCNPGYYLFDANNDCKLTCVKCNGDGQYLGSQEPRDGSGLCKKCSVTDCKICQSNRAFCQECVSGKFLYDSDKDKNYEKCDPCTMTSYMKYFLENTVGYCLPCDPSNCSTCNMKGTNCLQCSSNLFRLDALEDGVFETCSSANAASGYFKEATTDGTGKYVRCDSMIPYCNTCSNKNSCTACHANYYLFSTNNDATKDKCIQCAGNDMYFIVSAECKLCSRVITNCLKCSSADICLRCAEGYILNGAKECVSSCPPGFYVSVTSDQFAQCLACSSSISNCNACTDGKYCTQCADGKFLTSTQDNGLYDLCSDCSGNNVKPAQVNGKGVCSQIDKEVIGCVDPINTAGSLSCNSCHQPYILKASTSKCVLFCDTTEYLDLENNKCLKCPIDGCVDCGGKKATCQQCGPGKVLASNDYSIENNNFIQCVSCDPPQYYKESSLLEGRLVCRACSTKSNNCLECAGPKTCSKCTPGYFLYSNGASTTCVKCSEASQYRVNERCYDCSEKFPGCTKCSNPNKQCVDCTANLECIECSSGLFLRSSNNSTSYDSCVSCKAISQAVVGNVCKNCDQIIPKCGECFGNTKSCYKCSAGNYLYSSSSSQHNDVCSSCSDSNVLILTPKLTGGDGLCISCDILIPGCDTCAERICNKCKKGLYLFDKGDFSCSPCEGQRFVKSVRDGVDVCSLIPAPIQPNITLVSGESQAQFVFRCPAGKGSVLYTIGVKKSVVAANFDSIKSNLTGAEQEAKSSIIAPLGNSSFYGNLPYSTSDDKGVGLQIKNIDFGMNFHVGYYCINDIGVPSEKKVVPLGRFTNPLPERSMKEKHMEVWIPVGVSIFIIFLVAIIYSIVILMKSR